VLNNALRRLISNRRNEVIGRAADSIVEEPQG